MIDAEYVRTMEAYNRWQNASIYGAADGLSVAERLHDRGAFFGSIEATLNHLLWGDRMWMMRFADDPPPNVSSIKESPNECADWEALKAGRAETDARIAAWALKVSDEELAGDLTWYSGALERDVTRPLGALVMHFFNHQTHHRGQVHAMLTAAGAAPDDTDLFAMPEEWRAAS